MIDVIIPAYLPEEKYLKFLNRALKSLQNQTYKNFKIYLVLNGTYCEKKQIVDNIEYDGDITIFDLEKKASGAKARNYAIKNTSQKYIAYIDVDDQYQPEKLEKQLDFLEKNNSIGVLGTRTSYLIEGKIHPPKFSEDQFKSHHQIKNMIKYDNIIFHGSIMIRRQIFEKYNLFYNEDQKPGTFWPQYNRKMWEDWDLWIRMIDSGIQFHTLEESLYIWTIGTSVET